MKNIIIFLCLCTICMCRLHAADSSRADSLLLKLDQAIKERPIYMEQKELKLVELKRQLHRQIPDEERFAILGTLLDEYRSLHGRGKGTDSHTSWKPGIHRQCPHE